MLENTARSRESEGSQATPLEVDVFRPRLRKVAANDLVGKVAAHAVGPQGGTYLPEAATLFAIACGWSYGDGQTLADVLHRCGFSGTCRRVSATSGALFVDTDAYVVTEEGRFAVVVFRGTEIGDAKIIDILSDIYSQPKAFLGDEKLGQVHAGFQLAYLPIHDLLVEILEREARDVPALFVCGHSLGGALAVLAVATMFLGNGVDPELRRKLRGLYTYGQPMVGDEVFAEACTEHFGALSFRHVYQRDLVPQLPPRWTTGQFAHFGQEYRGTETTPWAPSETNVAQVRTAVVPVTVAAGAFVARQVMGLRWLASRVAYSLDDHRPQAYIDCSKIASGSLLFP